MKAKPEPLFSIIIPTYNSDGTLDIALTSIVNQTYSNIEVLIIDGLSTDDTIEIAKRKQNNFPNIIIKSEEDKGIYDAMNKGIKLAKGDWIYFMGSDDFLFEKNIIEKISKIIISEKIDVVYGNVYSTRFNGIYDGEFTKKKIIVKNICHQAIFINRRVFDEIGDFNLKYKSHADWDHNIRWFLSSNISKKFVDLVIANYADGGYSSLNNDFVFKKDLEQKYSLVSICIPTYNGSAFIAEAMGSAIAQTYPNLEIIISDDTSNDNTLKIIESYKSKTDIPIHIYHHQPNGIGANWNHTIKKANGTYIKFLFQDDILEPTCIEKMVRVLENDKSLGLVASKRSIIVVESFFNKQIEKWIENFGDLQKNLNLKTENGVNIIDKSLFKSDEFLKDPKNKIGEPSTILFKKELIDKIGFYREDLKQILDYEFCYRILKNHKIAIINNELVKFRLHSMQATNVNKDSNQADYIKYDEIIFNKYFWYLNTKTRMQLLKKKYSSINFLFRIKRKLRL